MPITVEVLPELKLRLIRFSGRIGDDELREYGYQVQAGFERAANALVDLRDASLDITASGVFALAELMQRPGMDAARRVAIVGTTDVGYGYGRMYQTLLERGRADVRVFRDYDEALRWITN